MNMNVARIEPGMVVDGFVLEEKLHKGGMATLWRVRRENAADGAPQEPLLMKIPFLGDNNDPAAIVGFEVEQMIMPKLTGIHVPRYIAAAQVALDLQNPEQVTLTGRAHKRARDGFFTVTKRWFHSIGMEGVPQQSASTQLALAPIVMVATDLEYGSEALAENLRLACVTVRKTNRISMDDIVDKKGRNIHVKHLVGLKHWARPLGIGPDKITYHVLEAPDAAAAIVDYAKVNDVDHIIIGSRGSSVLRRYLGSVSSQVVAQAECTVTVVKTAGSKSESA